MATVIISVGFVEEGSESSGREYVVHTSKNDVFGEDYEYFNSEMSARAEASEAKEELELAGYKVKMVWNCCRAPRATAS